MSDRVKPRLKYAAVEITSACNLHCGKCNAELNRKAGIPLRYIEKGFFEKVVDQLADLRCNLCLNYGGESLMHPQFKQFLADTCEAKKRGLGRVNFFDNGMLFNQDIAEAVIQTDVDQVIFSVDMYGHANDSFCEGSDYDVVSRNIKFLHELRGSRPKPQITINKIDVENPTTTWQFIRHWLRYVDDIQLSPLYAPKFHIHNPSVFYGGTEVIYPKHCYAPFSMTGILADGRVAGCCCDSEATNYMGNAKITTLKEIWNGTKYRHFRQCVKRNVQFCKTSFCLDCDRWTRRFKPQMEIIDGVRCDYGEVKTYRLENQNADSPNQLSIPQIQDL